MTTTSKKFGVLEKSFQALRELKYEELNAAYKSLKKSDCWTGTSYGRSERSMNIPATEVGDNNESIFYFNTSDSAFPGNTFDQAAPKLGKLFNHITANFFSNSGQSPDTNNSLEQLCSYLKNNKKNKWDVLLMTQTPDSTAGKLTKSADGMILNLGGSKNTDSSDYREHGIQRTQGELIALWTLQNLSKCIMEGNGTEKFQKNINDRIPQLYKHIDEWSCSETCGNLIDELQKCRNAFVTGRDTSKEVAKFLTKRLGQVKQIVGDNAYLGGGANTPNPRKGDVVIAISKSGGKEDFYSESLRNKKSPTVNFCEKSLDVGASVFPFVATEDSILEGICGKEKTTIVGNYKSGFSDAYASILTKQAIIPILLAEAYDNDDYDISPRNLNKAHGF